MTLDAAQIAEWQSIDTAPRDGTWFYAKAIQNAAEVVRVVQFADAHDRFPIHEGMDLWPFAPTLWKPLARTALDAIAAREAAERERDALREALAYLVTAFDGPDWRLCCDGHDCGCMGTTAYQQAIYNARVALKETPK